MNNTIYDTPEETPGYKGLHGEVVIEDTYRLRKLPFVPDVIFDLGANIGVFTRHAREVFPNALIVAVEPNPTNAYHITKFTNDPNAILINKAIGIGQIYHSKTAANGSGECYLSAGLGYPEELMPKDDRLELSDVETVMIDALVKEYVKKGQSYIIKMDIEGAENTVFTHEPSMKAIKTSDYFCAELHHYSMTGAEQEAVKLVTSASILSLIETHRYDKDHVHYYFLNKKHTWQQPIISPEIEAQ